MPVLAGDEVHLYVVPAANLSLATVGGAKEPHNLDKVHTGSATVRKSKGNLSDTAANKSTYDGDVLSRSRRDSPHGHNVTIRCPKASAGHPAEPPQD